MPEQKEKEKKQFKVKGLLLMTHYRLATFLSMALIFLLGYFFLLGPKYQELKTGGQFDLETKQAELANLEQQLENLKVLRQNLADLEKQDLSGLQSILPTKQDLPGLLVQMEKIASENDFALLNISFMPAPATAKGQTGGNSGLKKLNLAVSLTGGNYSDLLRLLDDFEYNLRLLDVTSINFAPNQAKASDSSYSLNLTTYYLTD